MRPAKQIFSQVLILLIGFPISTVYIYNQDDFNWWLGGVIGDRKMAADYPEHLILIAMVVMFLMSIRAMAIISTPAGYFRSRPGDETKHLDRMMTYRNGLMNGMTYEQGSSLMRETQLLDAANSGAYANNDQTRRVAAYMNSRLGAMSNEQGMAWLRNPNKK